MSSRAKSVALAAGAAVVLTCSALASQSGALAPMDAKLVGDYMAFWKKSDATALASMHDTEAVFVAADGVTIGREAIERRFAKNFAGPWQGGVIVLTAGASRTVAADVRIVEGTFTVTGLTDPSGGPRPVHGRYLNTLVNRGGTWLVAGGASFEVAAAAP